MAFIRRNNRTLWYKEPMQRIEIPQYMERCVMEVVVNALAHRDYLIQGSEVHVDMYDDRMILAWQESHPDIEVNFVENKGDTQGDTQDVPQGGTQGKDLDKWIEYQVAVYPKITTGELAQLSGKSIITIKRRIAKMPHIVYVGSGYSGHWEVRKKE